MEVILNDWRFIEWLMDKIQLQNTLGQKDCKFAELAVNSTFTSNYTYGLHNKTMTGADLLKRKFDEDINVNIKLCKREGQHAFKVINMKKHKRNRKPKFIKIGTDQDIINFFTEYKLLKS